MKIWDFICTWFGLKLIKELITDDSGRPSLIKTVVLVGYIVAFWIVIKLTLMKLMTDTIFVGFIGGISLNHIISKGIDRIKDPNDP